MIEPVDVEARAVAAKEDPEALEALLKDYIPFIARTVKDHIGHYVSAGSDDEMTEAMMAFSEAVKAFDPSKGHFLPLAARVIRLRLIDHYRRRSRRLQEVSLEASAERQDPGVDALAMLRHRSEEEAALKRWEILSFKEELAGWGITMQDLVQGTPMQKDLRTYYMGVARSLVADPVLLRQVLESRKLPLKALDGGRMGERKRLERGRLYIIACVLILNGEYETLQSYIGEVSP